MADRELSLYDLLPEYVRQEDTNQHTRRLLTASDKLLDQLHRTLQQFYADNFVDQPDDAEPNALFDLTSQEWLIPYFADLLDVRLVSPVQEGKRAEVTHAVRWRQGKGTLDIVDAIAEAVGQWEVIVQEGWKRLAMTPRLDQPLLPESYFGASPVLDKTMPSEMAKHPGLPASTIDFRKNSFAVADESFSPNSQVSTIYGKDIRWRPYYLHGAPCHHQRMDFNNQFHSAAFDDHSMRTPDLRNSDWRVGHYHPRKLLLYVVPPEGFFQANRPKVRWKQEWLDTDTLPADNFLEHVTLYSLLDQSLVFENRHFNDRSLKMVEVLGVFKLGQIPDTGVGDPDDGAWHFRGLILDNRIEADSGRVVFERCAVHHVEVHSIDLLKPVLTARDTLFRRTRTARSLMRLEYCTCLDVLVAESLQASDCIFYCEAQKDIPDNDKPPAPFCLRYSAIHPEQLPADLDHHFHNTRDNVFFMSDTFGDISCGVLHPASDDKVKYAAEDGTEPGCYHFLQLNLRLDAVKDKLYDYLPVGYEAVLIPDNTLHQFSITDTAMEAS